MMDRLQTLLSNSTCAATAWDSTVRVWDTSTGQAAFVLAAHTKPVSW
jgi:WD40 repeat protein